ncbi:MAG: hypothetical protein IH989_01025 [Planctomycetes bacterium]|nr:hypothetical protein [Planctomycetota bacterium]
MRNFPSVNIAVAVVWIQMPGFNDNQTTAGEAASTFNDPRVRHFYDSFPKHAAGKAFAEGHVTPNRGPAWDIYFFYNEGPEWVDGPPEPTAWMHQLSGGERADPDRFHTGDDLIAHLHAATHLITGKGCNRP